MKKLNFVSNLHNQTKRDYLERMTNNKVECMKKAKMYEFDYWDGMKIWIWRLQICKE